MQRPRDGGVNPCGGEAQCICKSAPILDSQGLFTEAAKSRPYLFPTGVTWEVLAWAIDFEEPEAASVIINYPLP